MCRRTIHPLPLAHLQMGNWSTAQACPLAENWTGNPSICRPALSPLSHTSQDSIILFIELSQGRGWRTRFLSYKFISGSLSCPQEVLRQWSAPLESSYQMRNYIFVQDNSFFKKNWGCFQLFSLPLLITHNLCSPSSLPECSLEIDIRLIDL